MRNGLVLGFFDGVHIAHKVVIESAKKYANNIVVITFKESPCVFFNKNIEYIYPRAKSINKMKALGVNEVIELDFNKLANISAQKYLQKIIQEFSPISISTGYNHTFGYNKSGNAEFLEQNAKKYNYKYICIPEEKYNNNIVSSTYIRTLLKQGNIEEANLLLDSNFSIEGIVRHGAKLGRQLGFPTANIEYPLNIVKIPFGVYYAKYKHHKCVLNWGIKPTINKEQKPIAEIHILDFDKNLYDQNIEIDIISKIRNEKKFKNLDELKTQIQKDINVCLKL